MSRRALPASVVRLAAALALILAATVALAPSIARADGDPASDVLVSRSLFLPYDVNASGKQEAKLAALLKDARQSGFPIRVAMIPSEYDLGAVGVLWRKPQTYARFLGIELSLTYTQRLLVVMPNGFGFNWPHHSTVSASRALSKVQIKPGGAGLLAATEAAIRRLAAAEGVDISSASTSSAATSGKSAGATSEASNGANTGYDLAAVVLALVVLAVVLVVGLLLSWRTRKGAGDASQAARAPAQSAAAEEESSKPVEPGWPSRAASLASVRSLRWAMTGAAALCAAAVVPVFVLADSRRSAATRASAAKSSPGEGPTTWREGQRRAPNFDLVDQNGRSISPAAYRGRPVIVTFIDPLCRELCPLTAKVLSEAVERLPAAQRPQIIAVSVDVYADKRADLLEDFSRWSLEPQWQWAVGRPGALAAVWKRYYAEVEVKTKRIAGTTVHFVTHSEMAYVIDGKGYERALFSWPFTPKQVDETVRGLSRS